MPSTVSTTNSLAMMLFLILASDILVRYRVRVVRSNKAVVAGE